jgi:hypothetical protein
MNKREDVIVGSLDNTCVSFIVQDNSHYKEMSDLTIELKQKAKDGFTQKIILWGVKAKEISGLIEDLKLAESKLLIKESKEATK